MLIICLFGTIVVLLIFLAWYLKKYHEEWWDWYDFEVKTLVAIITGVWILLCLAAMIIQSCPGEDTDVIELLNSRHKIIAEINSDDPVTHNHGVDEAIKYNQKVKYGKDQLNSLWSNWFTSRMWADTEYIEVDIDSYIIIPDTKE